VPAGKVEALRHEASAAGVVVTEVGAVAAGKGEARFLGADGAQLVFARPSFSHF
jgi:thiamine-monophosphate kinase